MPVFIYFVKMLIKMENLVSNDLICMKWVLTVKEIELWEQFVMEE